MIAAVIAVASSLWLISRTNEESIFIVRQVILEVVARCAVAWHDK